MKTASDGGEGRDNCRRKFLELGKRAWDTVHRTVKKSSLGKSIGNIHM